MKKHIRSKRKSQVPEDLNMKTDSDLFQWDLFQKKLQERYSTPFISKRRVSTDRHKRPLGEKQTTKKF